MMNPIDMAWVVLKRQTKLYNWIEDYPDKERVKYYHGSHEKVRPLIHQQGLVPQNEYANNEDWFRQLDDHPDPQYHISDEEWEKMINIGFVKLQYGSNPAAELWSRPSLFANEDDLIFRDVDTALQQFMTPALVGVKRMVQECSELFDAISSSPSQLPTVALMDGTLIPLGLIGRSIPEFVRRPFLEQGLLKTLSMFRSKAQQTPLAVASYISYPGSTEKTKCDT